MECLISPRWSEGLVGIKNTFEFYYETLTNWGGYTLRIYEFGQIYEHCFPPFFFFFFSFLLYLLVLDVTWKSCSDRCNEDKICNAFRSSLPSIHPNNCLALVLKLNCGRGESVVNLMICSIFSSLNLTWMCRTIVFV